MKMNMTSLVPESVTSAALIAIYGFLSFPQMYFPEEYKGRLCAFFVFIAAVKFYKDYRNIGKDFAGKFLVQQSIRKLIFVDYKFVSVDHCFTTITELCVLLFCLYQGFLLVDESNKKREHEELNTKIIDVQNGFFKRTGKTIKISKKS